MQTRKITAGETITAPDNRSPLLHTPGPWDWKDGIQLTVGIEPEPERLPIAHLEDRGPESFANARLIAAAPDLLAALEALLEYVDAVTSRGDNVEKKAARAALDKAKGQA